jgi:hypothetical protein
MKERDAYVLIMQDPHPEAMSGEHNALANNKDVPYPGEERQSSLLVHAQNAIVDDHRVIGLDGDGLSGRD